MQHCPVTQAMLSALRVVNVMFLTRAAAGLTAECVDVLYAGSKSHCGALQLGLSTSCLFID